MASNKIPWDFQVFPDFLEVFGNSLSFPGFPGLSECCDSNSFLIKQRILDADQKSIQKINFSGNLDSVGNKTTILILEYVKKDTLDFSQD